MLYRKRWGRGTISPFLPECVVVCGFFNLLERKVKMNEINLSRLTYVVAVCLFVMNSSYGVNLATNAGFETSETTGGGWPSNYGDWNGDHSAIVGTTDGITPYEGSGMLQFKGTSHYGAASSNTSEIFQLIDISDYSSLVASGNAVIKASLQFNRVDIDAQTDTRAAILLLAFDGSPSTFDARWESNTYGSAISYTSNGIYLDSNLQTWEKLELQFALPMNTDFIALRIATREDIYNDYSYPEFDGHFADAVFVEIIPEPATMLLLALGGIMARRKK